jgi:2,4-dienoyl-CoA reductase-like NADH-dependent reductase (Old Yellow Enzyme family)
MNINNKNILTSFTFPVSGIEIPNKIVMAPMTTFSGNDDGTTNNEEVAYYKERNESAGLLITACAYVIKHGKAFHGQIGADTDEMIPSLSRIAEALKENGGKTILQLQHGGRMSPPEELVDRQALSASAVAAEREGAQIPQEMTESEILETIEAFGQATRRAIEAGFDGVEIHGANTYLIQQFFSPHSNRRTDKWGGDVTKRMTFSLAVVDSVKNGAATAPQPFMVGYRISPEEMENPGISIDDTMQLVTALAAKKLDYLHISTMDFWAGSMRDKNDTTPRTILIAESVGHLIPIIGVGGIKTPEQAEKVLEAGISLVAMGRELLMDPNWLQKVKDNKQEQIQTELDTENQDLLSIPDPLWNLLLNRTGWLPLKNKND